MTLIIEHEEDGEIEKLENVAGWRISDSSELVVTFSLPWGVPEKEIFKLVVVLDPTNSVHVLQ